MSALAQKQTSHQGVSCPLYPQKRTSLLQFCNQAAAGIRRALSLPSNPPYSPNGAHINSGSSLRISSSVSRGKNANASSTTSRCCGVSA